MAAQTKEYKVESEHETLTSIADKFGVADWHDLYLFNKDLFDSKPEDDIIKDMNVLPVGLVLKIPDHDDHAVARQKLIARAKDADQHLKGSPEDPRWVNPIEQVSYTMLARRSPKPHLKGTPEARHYFTHGGLDLQRIQDRRVQIIDPDSNKLVHDEKWISLDFRGSFKVRLPRKTHRIEVEHWNFRFDPSDNPARFFNLMRQQPPSKPKAETPASSDPAQGTKPNS